MRLEFIHLIFNAWISESYLRFPSLIETKLKSLNIFDFEIERIIGIEYRRQSFNKIVERHAVFLRFQ